jgi:hypothetical protein
VTGGAEVTLCCAVNTPPERVAAAFAPLSALGAEVVLAVDDRVDAGWIEGYRELADRVLLVPFPGSFGAMYGWLRTQCSGRWILQLDLDEVPSAGLAAEVAQTIAAGDVTHAWLPRRWLYPDATRWLAQWPWRPDYALRLLRNDPALLRFPGLLHCTVRALGPARYLRSALYHADLLLTDRAGRERKLARYEREMPGFVIDGRPLNETYYLPEQRPDLRLVEVPAADAAAIAAFLAAGGSPAPGTRRAVPGELHDVSAVEIARHSEARVLAERDYRARVLLLDDDLQIVSGEARTFAVEVHNLSNARWAGGRDAAPRIFVGYRWLGRDGSPTREEGRTPLPGPVAPGERALVPLEVLGPARRGGREIEIDLVHEGERWFGWPVRARIEVRAPAGRARAKRTSAV